MIYLEQNVIDFDNDFRTMLQAFLPGEKIVIRQEDTTLRFQAELSATQTKLTLYTRTLHETDQPEEWREVERETAICDYRDKKQARNPIKAAAYHMLSRYFHRKLPWGGMTGVRPTKFATARLEEGWDRESIIGEYETVYLTTRQKGEICYAVAKKEQELFAGFTFPEEYCLYIGIPFCPSRCLYCSFASYPVGKFGDLIKPYMEALLRELDFVADAYKDKRLVAIYIGGGTPTALSSRELQQIIAYTKGKFDLRHLREWTVEAGRPDSIDEEKLRMLKEEGITRISINPQTMNDATLDLIGRAHHAEDIVQKYHLARACGHNNINMDTIVGLPGEDLSDVKRTMRRLRELEPESLTVHSLAIKRAADLNIRMQEYRASIHGSSDAMLREADLVATEMGMQPYYLYRQKNIPGNLENVGYAKPGKECYYNVLIMEEKMDILAVGAGTATKLTFPEENRIERVENVKNLQQYIDRVDEMIGRKDRALSEKDWYHGRVEHL